MLKHFASCVLLLTVAFTLDDIDVVQVGFVAHDDPETTAAKEMIRKVMETNLGNSSSQETSDSYDLQFNDKGTNDAETICHPGWCGTLKEGGANGLKICKERCTEETEFADGTIGPCSTINYNPSIARCCTRKDPCSFDNMRDLPGWQIYSKKLILKFSGKGTNDAATICDPGWCGTLKEGGDVGLKICKERCTAKTEFADGTIGPCSTINYNPSIARCCTRKSPCRFDSMRDLPGWNIYSRD